MLNLGRPFSIELQYWGLLCQRVEEILSAQHTISISSLWMQTLNPKPGAFCSKVRQKSPGELRRGSRRSVLPMIGLCACGVILSALQPRWLSNTIDAGNSEDGCSYCLATTLWDQNQFPLATLSDAYHGRWGIEELYKISKRLVEIEQFHSKSERGVKQELYAHFVLLALSRSFGNQFEDDLNAGVAFDQSKMRANFKNVLVTVARNFEALMLGNWQLTSVD